MTSKMTAAPRKFDALIPIELTFFFFITGIMFVFFIFFLFSLFFFWGGGGGVWWRNVGGENSLFNTVRLFTVVMI